MHHDKINEQQWWFLKDVMKLRDREYQSIWEKMEDRAENAYDQNMCHAEMKILNDKN